MEKVRPWCGQPSDRGRLKIRSDQAPTVRCIRVCVMAKCIKRLWMFSVKELHKLLDTVLFLCCVVSSRVLGCAGSCVVFSFFLLLSFSCVLLSSSSK